MFTATPSRFALGPWEGAFSSCLPPSLSQAVSPRKGHHPAAPPPFWTWREVSTWSSRGRKLPCVGVGPASSLLVLA